MHKECNLSRFSHELKHQNRNNIRRYDLLAEAVEEDTLMAGEIPMHEFSLVLTVLKESGLWSSDFLYEFLSAFWSLPEIFSFEQRERLTLALVEAPFQSISSNARLVVIDAISKICPEEKLSEVFSDLGNRDVLEREIKIVKSRTDQDLDIET